MSADAIELMIADASDDCVGMRVLARSWFADLGRELSEVHIRGVERLSALEFCTDGDLEELRGREAATLELLIEVVREVHLNAWHTPNHTPNGLNGQQRSPKEAQSCRSQSSPASH